ncbi:MAG: S8 family peptidase [Chloroflexota bacterium]
MSSHHPLKLAAFTAIIALFSLVLFSQTAVPSTASGDYIPNQYIVKLQPHINSQAASQALASTHNMGVGQVYSHAFNGFSAHIPQGRLNALQNDPRVVSIVPDEVLYISQPPCGTPNGGPCPPDDDDGGGNDGGGDSTQVIPTGINRIFAPNSSFNIGSGTANFSGVEVAVIDSGIDGNHPDLNVLGGINFSGGPSHRWSDGNGHGTHVAGTIAALDNDFGVVGVAPGAGLWAVKVCGNSGSCSLSAIIAGIDWVTANANRISVANMSLGGTGSPGSCTDGGYREAVCNSVAAGVTYVVAAGNSAADAANFRPANFPEVITVSALADFDGLPGGLGSPTCRTDTDDTLANFSNYGSVVDLIAPGVCILSTWPSNSYNTISGTSMASPHVAGAAALYIHQNPGASPAQVRNALVNAGNYNWDNSTDPDGIKEPLLDVGGF